MLIVGLTGGIASGKSAAADAFAQLGVPVSDADEISRALTTRGEPGYDRLLAALGRGILDAAGEIDRGRLRERLFADARLRQSVQNALHPLILARMQAELAAFDASYAVAAVPLLVESTPARALVNRVLVVDCPEALQIERLIARDGESRVSARAILAAQADREQRRAAGDDILFNTGSLADLARAVVQLHGLYLDLARAAPIGSRAAGSATFRDGTHVDVDHRAEPRR